MLCLTRKVCESVVIAERVTVTVLRIEGSRVVLGIDAPREMRIDRSERLDEQRSGAAA